MNRTFWGICGVLFVTASASAQDAPTILGKDDEVPNSESAKTGVVMLAPNEGQPFMADEAGEIYSKRDYKGVVPGIRDQSGIPSKTPEAEALSATDAVVDWIGFQPFPTYSRVFIQVSGRFSFAVTRPVQNRIVVSIPGARISTSNDLHNLVTRWFPTVVDQVSVRQVEGDEPGVMVDIDLKKSAGYLYRQEGRYIFVDVER